MADPIVKKWTHGLLVFSGYCCILAVRITKHLSNAVRTRHLYTMATSERRCATVDKMVTQSDPLYADMIYDMFSRL